MNERIKVPNDLKKIMEEQSTEEIKALQAEIEELKKRLADGQKELTEMKERFEALSTNQLPTYITTTLKLWQEPYDIKNLPDELGIVDPIYGYVTIEKELLPLLMHPLIQRLNFVRQLSFSYVEFPTAQHTRLSHSLGVSKNAEIALDTIFRHGRLYSSVGEKTISLSYEDYRKLVLEAKVAGLLHDIGHAPFGHCVDRYIGLRTELPYRGHFDKYFSHIYTEKYLHDLLTGNGFNVENIENVLATDKTDLTGYSELVAQIIDSALDVDRMDYLLRDAHISGLPLGFVNIREIIESIRPFSSDDHLYVTYASDAIYHIEHFLYARDAMYVNCYESAKKTAAEGMLIDALRDFSDTFKDKVSLEDIILLGDEQLLSTFIRFAPPSTPCFALAKKLIRGDIFVQVYELPLLSAEAQNNSEIKSLIDGIARPDSMTAVYLQRPNEWREALAKGVGLKKDDTWKILVTIPPPEAHQPKEVGVDLLSKKVGGYVTDKLVKKSSFVSDFLAIQTRARLKLRVFASSDLSEGDKNKVRETAASKFESP